MKSRWLEARWLGKEGAYGKNYTVTTKIRCLAGVGWGEQESRKRAMEREREGEGERETDRDRDRQLT